MFDYILSMAFSVLFEVLKRVIRDPGLKAAIRRAMLKLRDAINMAYGDEELFAAGAAMPFLKAGIGSVITGVEPSLLSEGLGLNEPIGVDVSGTADDSEKEKTTGAHPETLEP